MTSQLFKHTPFWFTRALASCTAGAFCFAGAAQAHEGHGLPGIAHWHGTDAWGFVVTAGIVALAIWMKGRK